MNVIPEEVYKLIELKLRKRDRMIRKAEEAVIRAREKATDTSAPIEGNGGGKSHNAGSRVERGALNVTRAEKRLEKVMKWEKVFKQMDKIYPAETNEGYVVSMIYGNGMSQAELARASGCDRQTVRMRQDRYIIRCAFMAAQAGLIREDEAEWQRPEALRK